MNEHTANKKKKVYFGRAWQEPTQTKLQFKSPWGSAKDLKIYETVGRCQMLGELAIEGQPAGCS